MGRRDDDFDDLDGEGIADQDEVVGEESVAEAVEDDAEDEADEEGGRSRSAGADYGDGIAEEGAEDFDETDLDLKVADEILSHRDQGARSLAIRRAIEERLEAKRLSRDLDYLDLDD